MNRQWMVGMVGLAAAGLLSMGCSSSSTTTTGTGGGGGHGTGGVTGGGGVAVGTGGVRTDASTDAPAGLCTGTALAGAPLITDFSDVTAPDAGGDPTIPGKGGTYKYGGTSIAVTGGALAVTGTIAAGTYAGAGIFLTDCIDASAYTGFMFTLSGDLGACDMYKLGALFPQDQPPPVPPNTGHGVCTAASCYGPGAAYTITTARVPFASMAGGNTVGGQIATVTADAQSRITGIDFGFHGPAATEASAGGCTVNFTIDDVKFY
jgi:hypothetical protein